MATKRTRANRARNIRFRRTLYQPPPYYRWNNHDVHNPASDFWNLENDGWMSHNTGNTVQPHFYWTGEGGASEGTPDWTGEIRPPLTDKRIVAGVKDIGFFGKITVTYEVADLTAGTVWLWCNVQGGSPGIRSTNGIVTSVFDINSATAAAQYYGFAWIPSSDFDGRVSPIVVDKVERKF